MATPEQIATATGMQNADAILRAARDIGVPLPVALALVQNESNGRNVFGSDAGGAYEDGGTVTEMKFWDFLRKIRDGAKTNGVGIMQITHKSLIEQAVREDYMLWDPYSNSLFGLRLLKSHYNEIGSRTWEWAAVAYNDGLSKGRLKTSTVYSKAFMRRVGEWTARLDGADEEETPVATWHLAPSLKRLQKDLDAEFGSNRPNDGTVGDLSHAARSSEHNPDNDPDPMPKGAVSAIDVYTAANGKTWITSAEFSRFLAILKKDSRVWYVIHKGFIYSRTNNFAKKAYTGSNPHTNHIHISLMQTKAAHDNTSSWKLENVKGGSTPAPTPPPPSTGLKKLPTLSRGDRDKILVPFLKRFFWATPPNQDEVFGSGLRSKVLAYQGKNGLVVDGVVGPRTWARIASGGTKLPQGYTL